MPARKILPLAEDVHNKKEDEIYMKFKMMFHVKHFIENEKIRYFLSNQKEHVKFELTSFEEQLIKNTNS